MIISDYQVRGLLFAALTSAPSDSQCLNLKDKFLLINPEPGVCMSENLDWFSPQAEYILATVFYFNILHNQLF